MSERPGTERSELVRASGYARSLAGLVLVLGVLGAVAGVVLVVNQLTQPGGNITVLLDDPVETVSVDAEGFPDGTSLDLAASLDEAELQVSELPAALRALTEAAMLVAGALWLVGAVFLRRVLLEIAAGRPFAPVVPARLAGLAVTVLALAVLPQAVDSLTTVLVLEHLGHRGEGSALGFTIFSLDLNPVIGAAVIAVVASVFRHGQRLTEDVEGLV